MKSPIVVGCLCCVVFAMVSISAQENYRGGIVYGPKAAFNIAAPEGWVLDNQAGVEQGLPCVLYPKGSSWADAKTIMYAKIASTQFEDVNAFVATAIKEMAKTHGKPKEKRMMPMTILLTNTQRQRITRSGSASPTFNSRIPSLSSFSHRAITRATRKIQVRCRKY